MLAETIVAPDIKSESTFYFQTDIIFADNSEVKANEPFNNVDDIVDGRNVTIRQANILGFDPIHRQPHLADLQSIAPNAAPAWYAQGCLGFSKRKQLYTLAEKSVIAMYSDLSQNALNDEIEQIVTYSQFKRS